MSGMNIEKLKEFLHLTEILLEEQQKFCKRKMDLPELFRMEVVGMVVRFCGQNGTLPEREVTFLNQLFDMQWNSQDYIYLYEEFSRMDSGFRENDEQYLWMDIPVEFLKIVAQMTVFTEKSIPLKEKETCRDWLTKIKKRHEE